ncbi:MAG: hypothetical protein IJH76_00400 [Clostridia bacterium]|nr:hypothetical protein [Clostridia bacterium]
MTLQEIDQYLENKLKSNEKIIEFTFYELRLKLNLSTEETYNFIHLVSTKLENNNYKIYRTGQEYYYRGTKKVEDNKLMIAIKRLNNI